MERINKLASIVFTMIIVACFVGTTGPALGAEEPTSKPVAKVNYYPDAIVWSPTVKDYEALLLTVSGPDGASFEETFFSGKEPVFERYDNCQTLFPDGPCHYELRLIPRVTEEIQKILFEKRFEPCTPLNQTIIALETAVVQSGGFTLVNGQIVVDEGGVKAEFEDGDGLTAQIKANDIGHHDDVYITGSVCLGFDCVNGTSFGFDTQIFKEHNLRLYFQDTSSAASYPRNDWRIVINDSTNGGGSYFAVFDAGENGDESTKVFALEANAPAHSLYVDDGGRVGFGTSTPYVELHTVDGDTPTLRLQQDGSYGWAAQTWDLAGNETNFFIRDVNNGSQLPFRIQPDTPSSTLTLRSTGYVGIGTWSPEGTFHIENNSSDDADDFIVTEDGNVGIGTTSPYRRLHLHETADIASYVLFTNVTTGVGLNSGYSVGLSGAEDGLVWLYESNNLRFATADTERMRIDSSGNVGIGTTTPAGKLDVNGAIYQRGGVLHADYVFEPGYTLESIDEHADFMFNNKHLKAVPKATADKNGIEIVEVGSHRRGILEELEKAHIYIHQLSNQNKNLEKRLAMLEALLVEKLQSDGMAGVGTK